MPYDARTPAAPLGTVRHQSKPEEHKPVELAPVKSSNLAAVGYDAAAKELHVQFKGKDGTVSKTYIHANVTPDQHAEFMKAESAGSHYAAKFRGNDKHPHRHP